MKTIDDYRIRETNGKFFIETIEEVETVTGHLWWRKSFKSKQWLDCNFAGNGIDMTKRSFTHSYLHSLGSLNDLEMAMFYINSWFKNKITIYHYPNDPKP